MGTLKAKTIENIFAFASGLLLMAAFDFLEGQYPDSIFGEYRWTLFVFTVVVLIIIVALYKRRKRKE